MNYFLIAIISLGFSFNTLAQKHSKKDAGKSENEENIVITPAEFPGGINALRNYIQTTLVIPEQALSKGIKDKVYIKFVILPNGEVGEHYITDGIPSCPDCESEVIRIIENMPLWTAAEGKSGPVECWFTLPVTFDIEKEKKKR